MRKNTVVVIALLLLFSAISAKGNTPNTFTSLSNMMANAFIKLFGVTQSQIDSIVSIIEAWAKYGDGDNNKLYYIMATSWHESRLMPIKEIEAAHNTSLWINYQSAYWPSGYYGRGFVQLTLKSNYEKMSNFLGVDLVSNPDLALVPEYAAKILVYGMMNGSFTGKRLSDYINSSKQDYVGARKIVNGTDRAQLIASYALDIKNNIV